MPANFAVRELHLLCRSRYSFLPLLVLLTKMCNFNIDLLEIVLEA